MQFTFTTILAFAAALSVAAAQPVQADSDIAAQALEVRFAAPEPFPSGNQDKDYMKHVDNPTKEETEPLLKESREDQSRRDQEAEKEAEDKRKQALNDNVKDHPKLDKLLGRK